MHRTSAGPHRTTATRPRIPTKEERAAELLRAERVAWRDRLKDAIRTGLECFAWCAVGLFLVGYAVHVTDEKTGQVAFYGGLVIGNSGIVASLYFAFLRARDRGDVS
ncbi:MAG: hypothetical protein U9Q74_15375 [Gemmatimonadota bacterium]|nr:hypothetical protein [Gemmatimonadota bacterium]